MDSPKHPDSWFIQTKADEIQGFSRFFKVKYRHIQGPINVLKILTKMSHNIFNQ